MLYGNKVLHGFSMTQLTQANSIYLIISILLKPQWILEQSKKDLMIITILDSKNSWMIFNWYLRTVLSSMEMRAKLARCVRT